MASVHARVHAAERGLAAPTASWLPECSCGHLRDGAHVPFEVSHVLSSFFCYYNSKIPASDTVGFNTVSVLIPVLWIRDI